MSRIFQRWASVTATLKRSAVSGGTLSTPATVATLKCFPLDPLDPEIQQLFAISSPYELLQTMVEPGSVKIREGDVLAVGSKNYRIRGVGEWPALNRRTTDYTLLVLEDIK